MRSGIIQSMEPRYGVNYKAGQDFFTMCFDHFVSLGIAFMTAHDYCLLDRKSHCGICIGENLGIEASAGVGAAESLFLVYLQGPKRKN